MREIKFRGKSKNTNEWVYGNLIIGNNYNFIITDEDYDNVVASLDTLVCHPIKKDSETICQFTGLYDKNGIEIYEGDLVYFCNANHDEEDGAMLVIFEDGEFAITGGGLYVSLCECYDWELEVVGNKFDNPELLEEV